MPASSRLRAVLALSLFLPLTLACFLFASHLASLCIGAETPDRAHLALLASQALGIGLPCFLAMECFRLGPAELGASVMPWRSLGPTGLLVLGLWPGLLALDALREGWMADPDRQELFRILVTPGIGGTAVVLLVLAALPAVMEEILFRGILHPLLEKAWGRGVAILLSAACFSAYHLSREQILVPFLLGIALAWLRSTTGSLFPCVLAHALHNAISALAMIHLPGWLGPPARVPPWPVWAGGLVLAFLAVRILGRRALPPPPDGR